MDHDDNCGSASKHGKRKGEIRRAEHCTRGGNIVQSVAVVASLAVGARYRALLCAGSESRFTADNLVWFHLRRHHHRDLCT